MSKWFVKVALRFDESQTYCEHHKAVTYYKFGV